PRWARTPAATGPAPWSSGSPTRTAPPSSSSSRRRHERGDAHAYGGGAAGGLRPRAGHGRLFAPARRRRAARPARGGRRLSGAGRDHGHPAPAPVGEPAGGTAAGDRARPP